MHMVKKLITLVLALLMTAPSSVFAQGRHLVPPDQLAAALLVLGVAVGVQEGDRDRGDPELPVFARDQPDALLVERAQLGAVEGEPASDLAHELERYDAWGLDPPRDVAEVAGHVLAADLEDVAEPLRHDEPDRRRAPSQRDEVGRVGRFAGKAYRGPGPVAVQVRVQVLPGGVPDVEQVRQDGADEDERQQAAPGGHEGRH